MSYRLLFLLPLTLLMTFGAFAQQTSKIHPLVADVLQKEGKADCIILLRAQPDLSLARQMPDKNTMGRYVYETLRKNAALSQKKLCAMLSQALVAYQPFFIVNAIATTADASLLQQIAALDEVAEILPNVPIRSEFPVKYEDPLSRVKSGSESAEWGIKTVRADKLWALNIKGAGVTVGGQDTGYDWDHPAILNQYRGNFGSGNVDHNFHWHDAIHGVHPMNVNDTLDNPCGYDSNEPCDDHYHGTHTMGTMVGYDGGDNYIGMAPEAKWIGCRNMERGWGLPSTYIECFEWFLAPSDLTNGAPNPELAPHVINNSWGCPTEEGCDPSNFEAMRLAVANLRMAGVVVVVSAGNSGPNCNTVNTPAAIFDESFSVGASTPVDTIVRFSSRGAVNVDGSLRTKPNVSAPGTSVRSSIPGGAYNYLSGTSMAGPHVAGAVALLISAEPSLAGRVELIEEILEQTAVPLASEQNCDGIKGTERPNNTSGWGRIDLLNALTVVRPDLVNGVEKGEYSLRLFPNPSDGHFMMVTPEDMGPSMLRIYNAAGQEVTQRSMNFIRVQQIDISELPNDFYLITVTPDADPKKRFTARYLKRG